MLSRKRGVLILWIGGVLLGGCSTSTGRTGPPPQVFIYPDAQAVRETTLSAPNALEIHQVLTYQTTATAAELIQFYVNESRIYGWSDIVIMEPNQRIDLVSVECPVFGLHVSITPTTTLQQVSLDYHSELCK